MESGIAEKLATCSHTSARGGSRRLKNTRLQACGSLLNAGVSSDR